MPGKNSKQTAQKTETPVAPIVVAKVETAPAQKGGKKVAAKVEAAPVVEVKVETAPAQKGGKKVAAKAETAPVVEVKVETAPAQKGGKKVAAKAETAPVVEAKVETAPVKGAKKAAAAKTEQKGGKKVAAKAEKKTAKKGYDEAEEVKILEEQEESTDRRVRSFKVRLPDKEEFEGRFTGLTPYQAANKALSKYFRETEKPQTKITFSICESTRKSKKSVYTYIGQRQKLDIPVTYKIQDGREIVKNFKNSLKKVKKSEATESA